jgi:small-conductance mechanosensitive channel
VESQEKTRFDRSHFKAYGDFSLVFETVYYVLGPDYNLYMDIQQAINFEIHAAFEREGIEFAYPTQTLYLSRSAPPASTATS